MHSSLIKAAIILSGGSTVQGLPQVRRDVIKALPISADNVDLRFRPILDFDSDGCYFTAPIDPSVYFRKRCNNGYRAFMYEHYFDKDQAVMGSFLGRHRHNWENVVVFTKDDSIVPVAPSCHGKYDQARNNVSIDDHHPQIVYHKDGAGTHCFRFAKKDDVVKPENPKGLFLPALVSWDHWPDVTLRNKIISTWNGGVGPKLDDEFGDTLKTTAGNGVPGFDPYRDQ
ncbi:hypothetical protein ACJA88_013648 [Fusarium oxysporum]